VNPRVAIAALTLAGCTATPTPEFGEARAAELAKAQVFQAFAEPCSLEAPPNAEPAANAPPPPATARPAPGPFTPEVFLETALFSLPTASATTPLSLQSLARDPDVRLLGTPHVAARFDVTSRALLEDRIGPLAQITLREITATPRPTADTQLAVELEAVLLLPTPQNAAGKPAQARLHFVAAPRAGQTVASTEPIPEQPGQSLLLLLRPYLVQHERDLRAIFLCKMAQRQRALASTR
jgi:hypothetical protein